MATSPTDEQPQKQEPAAAAQNAHPAKMEMRMPQSAHDALYSMYATNLGERLKTIENGIDPPAAPACKPFVIRLDGVAFSTFTKGIVKPFDFRLTDALVETTKDLVQRFCPVLGYSQSDEISLVFPAAIESSTTTTTTTTTPTATDDDLPPAKKAKFRREPTHMFGGRVQKLASVTASYASARLNYHLTQHTWSDLAPHISQRMLSYTAHFDARVVPTPDTATVMECIFWRSNFDGFRNAISQISHAHFTTKQLHRKGLKEQLAMLADIKKIDPFTDFNPRFLYGTWVKKEQYEMTGVVNPRTGEPVPGPVLRHRIRTGSFNWADWTADDRTAFVMAKLWTDDGPPKHPLLS
ncbi:hypothetical protein PhCBS80983_g05344 [Powellomyces hirtus]|uniref:tRNA(His) guanylyltransferase n=1 Tax=Powellomyces hirtus TaxID=109895 RepID=A0A507DWR8_9FUNG|nr:hypothetical protein PhCBS80983_g05344 [Powellomyces hirtus]